VANFAFGSNLSAEKMLNRGVKVESFCRATLPGWVLTFNQCGFPPCEPSFANIERRRDESEGQLPLDVHGIVFFIKPENFTTLWNGEGAGRWYREELVTVTSYEGDTYEGVTAFVSLPRRYTIGAVSVPPSPRYLALVQTGATTAKLDAEYTRMLLALPAAEHADRLSCILTPFFFGYINLSARVTARLGRFGLPFKYLEWFYTDIMQIIGRRFYKTRLEWLTTVVLLPGAFIGCIKGVVETAHKTLLPTSDTTT
jgi:hypothetical protein